MSKIKTAEEILDLYGVYLERTVNNSQDEQIPIVELMKEYAEQFIDLAIKDTIQFGELKHSPEYIGKESILKIKRLIK